MRVIETHQNEGDAYSRMYFLNWLDDAGVYFRVERMGNSWCVVIGF